MSKPLASVVLILSVLGFGFGAYGFFHTPAIVTVADPTATPTEDQEYGGSGSADYNFRQFLAGLSIGGAVIASSTSASVTLAGTEFQQATTLDYTVNVANKTLTLPASTTPMCNALQKNEMRTVYIRHASTTASNSLFIAGGTGMILKHAGAATSSAVLAGDTDGASFAQLDIRRLPSSDCVVGIILFND